MSHSPSLSSTTTITASTITKTISTTTVSAAATTATAAAAAAAAATITTTSATSATATASGEVTLEKILGATVLNDNAITFNHDGILAYAAGAMTVLYEPTKDKQIAFLAKKSNGGGRLSVSCMTFTDNGSFLAVGEMGMKPSIIVWNVSKGIIESELYGHKHGVACVRFLGRNTLASIGVQSDGSIIIWHWQSGCKLASCTVTTKIYSAAFVPSSGVFVTAGFRHIKYWNVEKMISIADRTSSSYSLSLPTRCNTLEGNVAVLGKHRKSTFIGVCHNRSKANTIVYSVTSSGVLCQFNEKRLLEKWVDVKRTARSLTVGSGVVVVGCEDGFIRIFEMASLQYLCTIPKPHALGNDVGNYYNCNPVQEDDSYPHAIALVLDRTGSLLSVIYSDHSLYVWNVKDKKKAYRYRSFFYHSNCIWDVQVCPQAQGDNPLPSDGFLTASSDGTIRLWRLHDKDYNVSSNINPNETTVFSNTRTIASSNNESELHHILYTRPPGELRVALLHPDLSRDSAYSSPSSRTGVSSNAHSKPSIDAVRCLRVSHDGQLIASGDRSGNLRVYDTVSFRELHCIEAHDAEVLCVDFLPATSNDGSYTVATASRDSLVHVFIVTRQHCTLVSTLNDHTGGVTASRFIPGSDCTRLITCGADKNIHIRALPKGNGTVKDDELKQYNIIVSGDNIFYDADVEMSNKYVAVVGQGQLIGVVDLDTGKTVRSYSADIWSKNTTNVSATSTSLMKVRFGPAGIYVATTASDKTVRIHDFYGGQLVATMTGHSELVTSCAFTSDCRHIITVSSDSCIMVWSLSYEITQTILERISEVCQATTSDQGSVHSTQILRHDGICNNINEIDNDHHVNKPIPRIRGCWAQRIGRDVTFYSDLNVDQPAVASLDNRDDRRQYTIEPETLGEELERLAAEALLVRKNNSREENETLLLESVCFDDDDPTDDVTAELLLAAPIPNSTLGSSLENDDDNENDSDNNNDAQEPYIDEEDVSKLDKKKLEDEANEFLPVSANENITDDTMPIEVVCPIEQQLLDKTALAVAISLSISESTDSDESNEEVTDRSISAASVEYADDVGEQEAEFFRNNFETLDGACDSCKKDEISPCENVDILPKVENCDKSSFNERSITRLSLSTRFLNRGRCNYEDSACVPSREMPPVSSLHSESTFSPASLSMTSNGIHKSGDVTPTSSSSTLTHSNQLNNEDFIANNTTDNSLLKNSAISSLFTSVEETLLEIETAKDKTKYLDAIMTVHNRLTRVLIEAGRPVIDSSTSENLLKTYSESLLSMISEKLSVTHSIGNNPNNTIIASTKEDELL